MTECKSVFRPFSPLRSAIENLLGSAIKETTQLLDSCCSVHGKLFNLIACHLELFPSIVFGVKTEQLYRSALCCVCASAYRRRRATSDCYVSQRLAGKSETLRNIQSINPTHYFPRNPVCRNLFGFASAQIRRKYQHIRVARVCRLHIIS